MTKDKKKIFSRKIIIGFPKARGGGLTSEVQIYFDTRGVDCFILIQNADLIAVSLACPKDAKSPYK